MLGDLYFYKNGNTPPSEPFDPSEWLDAWYEWGVGLEDGALDVLMTFKPNKEPIANKNVTAEGAFYVTGGGLVDERQVSIPIHIVAMDKADFLLKRAAFYNAIKGGMLTMRIANPVEATYKMYYLACQQYTQFLSGIAKFVLVMWESNRFDSDDDPASIEPMPLHRDMEQYLVDLLKTYGGLATEQEVRDIIRTYRTINTNGEFA